MTCWNCGKGPLHLESPSEYRRRKIENVKRSMRKAKANGTKLGRPRKVDYEKIRELRSKFNMSYSAIAVELKCSIASVQRALNE